MPEKKGLAYQLTVSFGLVCDWVFYSGDSLRWVTALFRNCSYLPLFSRKLMIIIKIGFASTFSLLLSIYAILLVVFTINELHVQGLYLRYVY